MKVPSSWLTKSNYQPGFYISVRDDDHNHSLIHHHVTPAEYLLIIGLCGDSTQSIRECLEKECNIPGARDEDILVNLLKTSPDVLKTVIGVLDLFTTAGVLNHGYILPDEDNNETYYMFLQEIEYDFCPLAGSFFQSEDGGRYGLQASVILKEMEPVYQWIRKAFLEKRGENMQKWCHLTESFLHDAGASLKAWVQNTTEEERQEACALMATLGVSWDTLQKPSENSTEIPVHWS